MIKILLSIVFLSVLPAQAMDVDFLGEEGKRLGRYPLYQESDSGGVKGNATLFKTKDGKYFGITCAHCIPYLNSLSLIPTKKRSYGNALSETSYSLIENIKVHPLYNGHGRDFKKEYSKYDIALFTIRYNSKIKYFDGEISTDVFMGNTNYEANVMSFGPLFSKDGSSYEDSIFHTLYSSLQFNEEGLFFHPFQSRFFYLSFLSTPNSEFTLSFGLLSDSDGDNLLQGDSGSLAINSEGKAIALASGLDLDPSQLLQFDNSLEETLKIKTYDEESKHRFLQQIENKVANRTQVLQTSSNKEIYVFKLKEGVPAIKGNDYYTPLSRHSEFISEYVKGVTTSPQEDEITIITVNRESVNDSFDDPDLVEEILNVREQVATSKTNENTLKERLCLEDLELLNSIDWNEASYEEQSL